MSEPVAVLTGASSFTGLHIARAMARAGWRLIAPLRGAEGSYEDVRGERVAQLQDCATVVFDSPFGSASFEQCLPEQDGWLLCHHAADVTDYRSPSFDPVAAFQRNAGHGRRVVETSKRRGCAGLVLTGSVFESGEGGRSVEAPSISPYGLSKTLTTSAFRHFALWADLAFKPFVVPNPFGPYEEKRFGWHLFQHWARGAVPEVRTPDYLRDNIPSLALAEAYERACRALLAGDVSTARPSGIVGSQGAFARLVAFEAGSRLGRDLRVELLSQESWEEPLSLQNDQPALRDGLLPEFWDEYVGYYEARLFGRGDA